MTHGWKVWLLALVPDLRFGRWLTAFVLFVLLYGAFRLARVFEEADEAAQAAAVFFSIIIAYIVPVYHLITERTLAAFDELEPELAAHSDQIARWRDMIARKTPLWTWSTLGVGALAGIGHNVLLAATPTVLLQRIASGIPAVAIVIGAELVWIVMMFVVTALLDNARLFYRLASHTNVNLIDPSRLTAFARVAVASTLALIGAQAAFPVLLVSPGWQRGCDGAGTPGHGDSDALPAGATDLANPSRDRDSEGARTETNQYTASFDAGYRRRGGATHTCQSAADLSP